jgi:hypothetical protein
MHTMYGKDNLIVTFGMYLPIWKFTFLKVMAYLPTHVHLHTYIMYVDLGNQETVIV